MTMKWHELHWQRPLSRLQAIGLLTRLASDIDLGTIVFEARAEAGRIRYLLGGRPDDIRHVRSILSELIPGTATTRADQRQQVERAGRVRISQRALSLAIETGDQVLRAVLAALAAAKKTGDVLVLQVVLAGAVPPQSLPGKVADPTASIWSTLLHGATTASTDLHKNMQGKLSQYRFRALVRLGVSAASPARRQLLVHGVLSALRQLQSGSTKLDLIRLDPEHVNDAAIPVRTPLRLTPDETLAFLAWPCSDDELPGLVPLHPRKLTPMVALASKPERVFAVTTAPGESVPVGIDIVDGLRHTHVMAPTGEGKSTLLLNLIASDIRANRSVVVVDPKLDLARDVLSLIPEKRIADVVVIDPTLDRPVSIDPLHGHGIDPTQAADGALAIFKGMFPSAFGPRVTDTFHAALLTLAMHPGTTLADLPRLFTNPRYRATLTASIDDPIGLGGFWAQFDALSSAAQAAAIAPLLTRLRQFLLRPGLRAILSDPAPRFQLNDVLTRPRILILSLNKGILGATAASLLGSLVVSQLWQLILARAAIDKNTRAPVSIYLDEAQMFLHLDGDLGEALEQSRSMGALWHIAHQHRSQMPAGLLAGIDANTLNKVVFALQPADARTVAQGSSRISQEDIMALPPYEVYASLLSGGKKTGWFSARTLPPPQAISDPDAVLAESQARYGTTLDTTQTATPAPSANPDDEPLGRRRRGE